MNNRTETARLYKIISAEAYESAKLERNIKELFSAANRNVETAATLVFAVYLAFLGHDIKRIEVCRKCMPVIDSMIMTDRGTYFIQYKNGTVSTNDLYSIQRRCNDLGKKYGKITVICRNYRSFPEYENIEFQSIEGILDGFSKGCQDNAYIRCLNDALSEINERNSYGAEYTDAKITTFVESMNKIKRRH